MRLPARLASRSLTLWLAAAAIACAASLYFMGNGGGPGGESAGANSFSRSAIGHAGIAEILQRRGIPAVKSRYGSLAKLGKGSVLVLAEPELGMQSLQALRPLLGAPVTLLVLPKWRGEESRLRPGRVDAVAPIPDFAAKAILTLAVPQAELLRRDAVDAWPINALGPSPVLATPVQLIRSDRLRPLVASADGILLGELRTKTGRLFVLADPDVMENHGIAADGNAAFFVALVDLIRGGDGKVVFDETIHGFLARPSDPFRLLVSFPYVLATLQGALAILLMLWGAGGRFGAPETLPLALPAGKAGLLENSAKLLDVGGHRRAVARRYVLETIRDVGRRLHAPRDLADGALVEWLERVRRARDVEIDGAQLCRRAEEAAARRGDTPALAALVRDARNWKQGMIDGPSGHSRDH